MEPIKRLTSVCVMLNNISMCLAASVIISDKSLTTMLVCKPNTTDRLF